MAEQIVRKHADVRGSEFEDLNLSGSRFKNVNLSKTVFHDVSFGDASIGAADFGGARFTHIGPPPDKSGRHPSQRPVSFSQSDLNGSTFEDVDLSNVRISNCRIEGMTINGILVSDMIDAYRQR